MKNPVIQLHCTCQVERRINAALMFRFSLHCNAWMIFTSDFCWCLLCNHLIMSHCVFELTFSYFHLHSYFQLHQANFSSHPLAQINITYCTQPEAQKALQWFSVSSFSHFLSQRERYCTVMEDHPALCMDPHRSYFSVWYMIVHWISLKWRLF